jgi:hypothetical protein
MLLVATSLASLLGGLVYNKVFVCDISDLKALLCENSVFKEISNTSCNFQEVASATVKATTTTNSAPVTTMTSTKTTEPVYNDSLPDIGLVPTDDVESDEDDDQDDCNEEANSQEEISQQFSSPAIDVTSEEETYTLRYPTPADNVVSDSEEDSEEEEDEDTWISPPATRSARKAPKTIVEELVEEFDGDEDDWNEEEYNRRFPVSKSIFSPPATRSSRKDMFSPPRTRSAAKKESLSQMRKRVAREMKDSEDRRRQQLSTTKTARPTPPMMKKRTTRKESVAEMKARVAREFAAKLKN